MRHVTGAGEGGGKRGTQLTALMNDEVRSPVLHKYQQIGRSRSGSDVDEHIGNDQPHPLRWRQSGRMRESGAVTIVCLLCG
ncbi:MAG: hypothetical protein NVS2B16_00930 [Chloroflexota bacterium]